MIILLHSPEEFHKIFTIWVSNVKKSTKRTKTISQNWGISQYTLPHPRTQKPPLPMIIGEEVHLDQFGSWDWMWRFNIRLIYWDRERSSSSASVRSFCSRSLSMVMLIFSFNGFIFAHLCLYDTTFFDKRLQIATKSHIILPSIRNEVVAMLVIFNHQIFTGNLKQLRKKRGLSQKRLAEMANISVYLIRGLEKGIFPAELMHDQFIRLCDALRIEPTVMATVDLTQDGEKV